MIIAGGSCISRSRQKALAALDQAGAQLARAFGQRHGCFVIRIGNNTVRCR